MLKEINKAVDIFQRIAFGTKNNTKKLPEAKISAFNKALTELLKVRYEKNWYPENPDKGSGYRCIRVNGQSIDPTIIESLKQAKIKFSKGLIITELTIWVDPGVVSVRIGEDGSIGSEVVDEEVYKIGREFSMKRSVLESDEGFSSRSPSPANSLPDPSAPKSACSSKSSSPIPSKFRASPSPSNMDVNPYSAPIHITYPSLYQQQPTSSAPQQPQRNSSPSSSNPQTHAVRSNLRPVIQFAPSIVSAQNRDIFSQPSYIPVSAAQSATAYGRSRPVLSNQESISFSGAPYDAFGKMAFNPYHTMSMMYGGNLQHTNFYDIPAVA